MTKVRAREPEADDPFGVTYRLPVASAKAQASRLHASSQGT